MTELEQLLGIETSLNTKFKNYSEMVKTRKNKDEVQKEEREAKEFVKRVQAKEFERRQKLQSLKQQQETR